VNPTGGEGPNGTDIYPFSAESSMKLGYADFDPSWCLLTETTYPWRDCVPWGRLDLTQHIDDVRHVVALAQANSVQSEVEQQALGLGDQ
jgi:hypothetical protein